MPTKQPPFLVLVLLFVSFAGIFRGFGGPLFFPSEGSVLNYRIVGFSAPFSKNNAGDQRLEVADGIFNNYSEFSKHIIQSVSWKTNRPTVEVPSFGRDYTWCITAGSTSKPGKTEFHHFKTGFLPQVDTSLYRLKVLKQADEADAFVFLDNNRVLYDMKGNPVWYLPYIDSVVDENTSVRDLKISHSGTITFLGWNSVPFELSYDGRVLWRGSNSGSVSGGPNERYHHEFTKLQNGHYMVLATEILPMPASGVGEERVMQMYPMGIIIEYDSSGKVLWTWKTSKYFKESDMVNFRPDNGPVVVDFHENAFFFDEVNSIIYLSYKNVSRIIKIKYPEGNVVGTIGSPIQEGKPLKYNGLFCGQHACKYSQIGCLFLFNNNGCNPGAGPKIKMLKEETSGPQPVVKKIWEYDCLVADGFPKEAPSGGNVQELEDHSMFVSMGGAYSKVFIVNMDKKELWSALPEKWVPEEKKWAPLIQYRASMIDRRKELEQMIWKRRENE